MKKLLAIGGIAVVGFLVFLMLQLNSSADPAPAADVKAQGPLIEKIDGDKARSAAIPVAAAKPADDKPKKLDPQSDEFFFQFDELGTKKYAMAAAECYENVGLRRKHRNQHLKVQFNRVIKDGEVTVRDMKMLPDSNLNDPEMEKCMMNKMAAVKWHDDSLPDGVWDDQEKISPERGMKKYLKDEMAYEGDPNGLPVGKAVMTPNQPPPISDSATRGGFEAAAAAGR